MQRRALIAAGTGAGLMLMLIGGTPDATAVGQSFPISWLTHDQVHVAVAYNSQDDEYLAVWHNEWPGNKDIYSRVVEGNGTTPASSLVVVFTNDDETTPDVASSKASSTFLVAWTAPWGATTGVRQQRLTLSNTFDGAAEWVGGNNADNGAVAADGGGSFLVAYDTLPVPANGRDLYGWMSNLLFADGFESGTTGAWFAAQP